MSDITRKRLKRHQNITQLTLAKKTRRNVVTVGNATCQMVEDVRKSVQEPCSLCLHLPSGRAC
eukprot:834608-Rhodomonas_salina.1